MTFPTSTDSEWAVLSALVAGSAYTVHQVIGAGLTPEHFANPPLGMAYRVLTDLVTNHGALDKPLFRRALHQQIADIGHDAELADQIIQTVYDNRETPSTALPHTRRLMNAALLTSARTTFEVLYREGETCDTSEPGAATEFVAEAQRRVMELTQKRVDNRSRRVADLMPELSEKLRAEYDAPNGLRGYSYGMPQLDKMTRGLCAGHLIIVAAESGAGKSAFASNIAVNVAKQKRSVQIFSLEMDWSEILERMVFAEARLDTALFRARKMEPHHWERLKQAEDRLTDLPIELNDDSGMTLPRLVSECRHAKFRNACDFVVVDYTQLLTMGAASVTGRMAENRQLEVAAISRSLKQLAKELKSPVMSLSQLNDDGKVRESRTILQDADVLLVLKCLEDADSPAFTDKDSHEYDIVVSKCRGGKRGKSGVLFWPSFTKFEEVSHVHDID